MKTYVLPAYIRYFFKLAFLLMVLFTLFRLLLYFLQQTQLTPEAKPFVLQALFNRGLLFDASVVSYTIAPVFLLLSIGYFFNIASKIYYKFSIGLSLLLSMATLFLCCADLPFFQYYNFRLTNAVFVLSQNDSIWLILRDIFTNPIYLPYTLLFFTGAIGLGLAIRTFGRPLIRQHEQQKKGWKNILIFLVSGYLVFSGIRGDLNPDAKPLKLEHAYFTDYTFINQLGLNATYSFIDSYRAFKLNYLKDEDALANVQRFLGIQQTYDSPVARMENQGKSGILPNVVVVLIESLSANKMGLYENKNGLTPNLDSLALNSLTFKNTYTAGIHTHNGIYSSITGLPAIMHNTPMLSAQTSSQSFSGLANTLEKKGYSTIFFATGKRNFDNMQGFLPRNGYNELVSKRNYPKKQWINRWGVPDHCMFDYSIPKLDSLAALNAPFLATFMTISTHNPYSIPTGIAFTATTNDPIDRSYQYTDWSIGKFLREVRNKVWYDNTIFVFIGDHGQNFDPVYEVPLAYHHTPMIFHSAQLILPMLNEELALQIDLFPTLMGLMNQQFINNTLGVNLLEKKRPYAFFSADNRLACLNEQFYLIMNKRGKTSLYRYKEKSLIDVKEEQASLVDSMKIHVFSMLQTAQWMINHRKTALPKES
jgi:phosphoglycerol transferase MdoB-like AlkP superfamily enzyme